MERLGKRLGTQVGESRKQVGKHSTKG
jgi:hypothetical protein